MLEPLWKGTTVRVTGVGFFDVNHLQVGRSRSCIELHPIVTIERVPFHVIGTKAADDLQGVSENDIRAAVKGYRKGRSKPELTVVAEAAEAR